ncbi:hypothetical protein ON010_g3079 [Phytophthora cinnamomi]|nr:hypothetical protein ON010_g3079 [Phytophthora cinnamomi]
MECQRKCRCREIFGGKVASDWVLLTGGWVLLLAGQGGRVRGRGEHRHRELRGGPDHDHHLAAGEERREPVPGLGLGVPAGPAGLHLVRHEGQVQRRHERQLHRDRHHDARVVSAARGGGCGVEGPQREEPGSRTHLQLLDVLVAADPRTQTKLAGEELLGRAAQPVGRAQDRRLPVHAQVRGVRPRRGDQAQHPDTAAHGARVPRPVLDHHLAVPVRPRTRLRCAHVLPTIHGGFGELLVERGRGAHPRLYPQLAQRESAEGPPNATKSPLSNDQRDYHPIHPVVDNSQVDDCAITTFDGANMYVLDDGIRWLGGTLDAMFCQYAAVPVQSVVQDCALGRVERNLVPLSSLVVIGREAQCPGQENHELWSYQSMIIIAWCNTSFENGSDGPASPEAILDFIHSFDEDDEDDAFYFE